MTVIMSAETVEVVSVTVTTVDSVEKVLMTVIMSAESVEVVSVTVSVTVTTVDSVENLTVTADSVGVVQETDSAPAPRSLLLLANSPSQTKMNYRLRPLQFVHVYISENNHLTLSSPSYII